MYGELNGHAIGIIMKELVRRAIAVIETEKLAFEVSEKRGYDGEMGDLFTSADTKAQEVYLRSLRECFPTFGIVAEEANLRIDPTGPLDAWFTLDPLDGTKAFVRRQSHGVGTMISLVIDGQVEAAFVGDVNTHEVYGFRPGSDKVHRLNRQGLGRPLAFDGSAPLTERYVLLHDPLEEYSAPSREIFASDFRGYEVMGGSVGTWLARLWKGEVGAAALPPSFETPWDAAPILGISKRMGFRFVEVRGGSAVVVDPEIPLKQILRRDHDLFIVHDSHLESFLA